MDHDITHYAKSRHTVKAYDPTKKVSDENIAKIKELLRYSASSTNAQPWHFVIASTTEGKEKIAKSTDRLYPFNRNSIVNASHVVVFCSKLDIEEDYLLHVLAQEEKDGRFGGNPEFKEQMHAGRSLFVNLHKHDFKDVQHWMDKQVYLNLGAFLLGVSTLGIDSTPMEGIEINELDKQLGLREQGFTALVVVTIGYHHEEDDYNAKLPKSRLPETDTITLI